MRLLVRPTEWLCLDGTIPQNVVCGEVRFALRRRPSARHRKMANNKPTFRSKCFLSLLSDLNRICIEHGGEWDVHLPSAVKGLNSKIHDTTRYSRFEMMFGRSSSVSTGDESQEKAFVEDEFFDDAAQTDFLDQRSRAMADVFAQASRNILKGQKKQRVGYSKRQKSKTKIKIGTKVFVDNEISKKGLITGKWKTGHKFSGPSFVRSIVRKGHAVELTDIYGEELDKAVPVKYVRTDGSEVRRRSPESSPAESDTRSDASIESHNSFHPPPQAKSAQTSLYGRIFFVVSNETIIPR